MKSAALWLHFFNYIFAISIFNSVSLAFKHAC
ncbi:hypothetical protein Glaag_2224 [Glaciecola sp. 4H-3-7+YE-5]|nr:hypothetical protein Glaag_2224 [Glaciecola sp. 4H-3-7+YE-5]